MNKYIPMLGVALTMSYVLTGQSWAALGTAWTWNTIHCDVTLATGGPASKDDVVTCAVNIKEIAGFCKNPKGESATAQGKPFRLQSFAMGSSLNGTWTQTGNGSAEQDIKISNQMLQLAFDIYNAKNGLPFVFLKTTSQKCPNGNWKWFGWIETKVDSALTWVKVPSGTNASGNIISGTAKYLTYTPTYDTNDPNGKDAHCRNLQLPNWNWTWDNPDGIASTPDGDNGTGTGTYTTTSTYTDCDFIGEPFNYCSRFTDGTTGPDAKPADSGLRIYDTSQGTYTGTANQVLDPRDGTYEVKQCYLWRDVNKDPNFSLSAFGTYDPDIAHIISPQTGNVDGGDDNNLGGMVLRSVSVDPNVKNYYTGECHQHGQENNNGKLGSYTNANYHWTQQGPAKSLCCDSSGALIIRDAICQGASQLMDGTYTDGILP